MCLFWPLCWRRAEGLEILSCCSPQPAGIPEVCNILKKEKTLGGESEENYSHRGGAAAHGLIFSSCYVCALTNIWQLPESFLVSVKAVFCQGRKKNGPVFEVGLYLFSLFQMHVTLIRRESVITLRRKDIFQWVPAGGMTADISKSTSSALFHTCFLLRVWVVFCACLEL